MIKKEEKNLCSGLIELGYKGRSFSRIFMKMSASADHCGQHVTVSLFKGNTVMQFTGGRGRNVG